MLNSFLRGVVAGMGEAFFEIPFLFNVLCFLLASVFLLSPAMWLWELRGGDMKASLVLLVFSGAVHVVFLAAAFSLIYGVSVGGVAALERLIPEIVIMAIFIPMWRRARACFSLAGLILLLWTGVVAIGGGVVVGAVLLGLPAAIEMGVMAVAACGFGGFILFHRRVMRGIPEDFSGKRAFHDIIWPIVVGLMLLIFPLWLQQLAHDPEFYRQINMPPRLQGV